MSETHYAPAVGDKFYKDGRVKYFPGNTIICFADPKSQAYQEAEWVQQQIVNEAYGNKFTMLPPSSFHMTVFELLCDEVRDEEHWSSHLSLDAPLVETDQYFIETVPQVKAPANFRMQFTGLGLGRSGIMLNLKPADDETHQAIWQYRDELSEVTGIRFPNHETYGFHLSLAYRIIQLSDDEETQLEQLARQVNQRLVETCDVFDTGQPMLTFFDDMFAFVPIDKRHTLKSRSTS